MTPFRLLTYRQEEYFIANYAVKSETEEVRRSEIQTAEPVRSDAFLHFSLWRISSRVCYIQLK
jgi:hypothetical protein